MTTAHLKLAVAFALVAFALVLPYGTGVGVVRAQEAAPEAAPAPLLAPEAEPAARAWVLADARSGEVLAGEDASARLPMASTTKIMVALLAFEKADLDEEVVVSGRAAAFARPIYSNVGLLPGDVLSVRELLMGTLISSGDDAVYALAEHLGGGGEAGADAFVEEMNRKARALGLRDTHFENPSGLDARGQYSSARDLAAMTRAAMEYPGFREMVSTPRATITTQDREIPLYSTNALLSAYPPATGVKTGTTPAAGSCLVASAASGDESYITVVLDAREDRFSASARLLEQAFRDYDREKLILRGERYAGARVPYRREKTVDLVAEKDVEALVPRGSKVGREVEMVGDLPGSARPGARLGTVAVTVHGERVGESPLVAREGYERASPWERVWYTVEGFFQRGQEKGTRRS